MCDTADTAGKNELRPLEYSELPAKLNTVDQKPQEKDQSQNGLIVRDNSKYFAEEQPDQS